MSIKALFGSVTAATVAIALVGAPGVASAATYVSYLEYWDDEEGDGITKVAPFGTVTIEELADGKTVRLTAELYQAGADFQQSGKNRVFAFNVLDEEFGSDASTPSMDAATDALVDYTDDPYVMPAFGTFQNSFFINASGNNNASLHPFVFEMYNADGLTFAGIGATFGAGGRLIGTGTGNQFTSNNPGGWWFASHIQPVGSESINIAARDAFCVDGCTTGVVPEPGTWALMIIGFGGAGAMLRRRRHALA